jgi:hypothetical protein
MESMTSGDAWTGDYKHTQRGNLVIAAVTAVILVIASTTVAFGFVWVTLFVGAIMLFVLALFSTLTVSVRNGALSLAFGPVHL